MSDKLITMAQVARRVGRTPRTIQRWCDAGEFPQPIRVNGRCWFFEEDIDSWSARARAALAEPRPKKPMPQKLSPHGREAVNARLATFQRQRQATYPPEIETTPASTGWRDEIRRATAAVAEAQRRVEMAQAAEAAQALRLQGLRAAFDH